MSSPRADILLVDDDPDLLRLLSLRLTASNFEVKTAESAEAALAFLATTQPRLIITDLRMAGMDGLALFQAVQQQFPHIPVMILTAHGTIPEAVKATQAGVFGFLSKPFDSKELLEQTRQALALSGFKTVAQTDDEWRRDIVTRSTRMAITLSEAWRVAQSGANVLIHGESGTGKELLAKAVHRASSRNDQPFLALNCSAIPADLLESELFGYSKGAFTGAANAYPGLFQAAVGGTLFLDEIGDMPLALQAKLLRAVQERQIRPLGSTQSISVDVRIIAATHRDLEAMMEQGDFREDLFYRLSVVALTLPPLRDRREDIPLLANHFLTLLGEREQRSFTGFAPEALECLISAPWPGNVRQLSNVVEYCVALSTTALIPLNLVKKALRDKTGDLPALAEARQQFERDYLVQVLRLAGGNVSRAARLAQRNRTEFYKLLNRHQLNPSQFKGSD
ncbi:MAG: sigma 54-interacting transcriptional regulator [Gammaproteobacteria bacterium]|nr:sigma 54-interacting transcriptional regulator [Gammaproteobacteria bacterium]MCP5425075.1 sigma 54-interacting transcriptional regulator [Gammaproteobacteria bacterium]